VFTARYALSPYIKQIRSVFKGLKEVMSGRLGLAQVHLSHGAAARLGNVIGEAIKTDDLANCVSDKGCDMLWGKGLNSR
jgi:hypothetical protein